MKPTDLVKGRKYRIKGTLGDAVVGKFIERIDRSKSFFIVEEYKGLDGPDDDGKVQMSDYDIARKVEEIREY